MTTDITKLAQSLKNAASKALIEEGMTWFSEEQLSHEDGIALHKADAEFIALANPANVLALVEALEKAQGMEAYWKTQCRGITDHCEELQARIAELESRTVTVKQGEVLVTVAGFTGCGKSAIAGEIEIAMKAIGLPVTWANGDSEKRMTGADWLTAIEMYKPTVRIVEVNIPRAAGIKVEAE
ncbi:ead/Ea22-like family protein [Klebsiella variicola]|uniref:ead/Ea22-like family protein n=1 Tax=Klebsiella variicola TaxID=244366 RepID=UPI0011EE83F0|nr:ead/Ea22-like family protein [Klebsiella variicola]KAA0469293.1 ead/Ea22-like family protein [Klebsiella variicola]